VQQTCSTPTLAVHAALLLHSFQFLGNPGNLLSSAAFQLCCYILAACSLVSKDTNSHLVVRQDAHAALQRQLLLLWRAEHGGVQLEANLQQSSSNPDMFKPLYSKPRQGRVMKARHSTVGHAQKLAQTQLHS
jgi:hypothetical protein